MFEALKAQPFSVSHVAQLWPLQMAHPPVSDEWERALLCGIRADFGLVKAAMRAGIRSLRIVHARASSLGAMTTGFAKAAAQEVPGYEHRVVEIQAAEDMLAVVAQELRGAGIETEVRCDAAL